MSVDKGDVVRCSCSFVDQSTGQTVDPPTVRFHFKAPSGAATMWTYGTDAQVVRDGPGLYHADVTASESGTWTRKWDSLGANAAATPDETFVVGGSIF